MAPEIFYGIGAIILLGALAYGATHYGRRSRALDVAANQKVKQLYRESDE